MGDNYGELRVLRKESGYSYRGRSTVRPYAKSLTRMSASKARKKASRSAKKVRRTTKRTSKRRTRRSPSRSTSLGRSSYRPNSSSASRSHRSLRLTRRRRKARESRAIASLQARAREVLPGRRYRKRKYGGDSRVGKWIKWGTV